MYVRRPWAFCWAAFQQANLKLNRWCEHVETAVLVYRCIGVCVCFDVGAMRWWWKIAGWRSSGDYFCILFGWDKPTLFKKTGFSRLKWQKINFWTACNVSNQHAPRSFAITLDYLAVLHSRMKIYGFSSCHFYGSVSNSIFIFSFRFR